MKKFEEKLQEYKDKNNKSVSCEKGKRKGPTKWGAKKYLSEFEVGQIKEFTEADNLLYRTLQVMASRMNEEYGVEFIFATKLKTGRKFIARIA